MRLRCQSGLLGCWLHPLDGVSDSGVGGLFGGNGALLALMLRFNAFGCGCGWVGMRGGKYKVLEGIELFWTELMRKDGSDFGGVVQAIRGETD